MKRRTLKGNFILCMVLVIVGLLFSCGLLFVTMHYIHGQMEELVNINNRTFGVESAVENAMEAYRYCVLNGSEENIEMVYQAVGDLNVEIYCLKEQIFEKSYVREIDDLYNMVDTFTGQIMEGIENYSLQLMKERIKCYEDVEYTRELISDYYDYIYRAMEEFSDEEQIRLTREKKIVSAILLFVVMLVFLGIMVMLRWFSTEVVRPISELAVKAANFRAESPNPHIEQVNEIQALTYTFDDMMVRIEQQVVQLEVNMRLELELKQQRLEKVKMEKLLQESEVKALQARINPHFMFNTLNSVAQMAYIEGAEQTEQMVEAVSDYFRYNLKDIHHVATLSEEIKNVKDYITIQKMRFGDRICFVVDYDNSVDNGKLPALTIQPIIENCIVHGLGLCTENGQVKISVIRTGINREKIKIIIADNGIGMEEVQINMINDYISGKQTRGMKSESIGLKNVIDRMRAFFESDFIMSVKSNKNEMTVIEITIPYEENLCLKY